MTPKQKSLVIGAVIGALVGAAGGYLFSRGMDQPRADKGSRELSVRSVPPGEIVKLVIATLAVLRGIAELGERL
jgi:hypothetical protein